MKVLLDSNVWRYIADYGDVDKLVQVTEECRVEIVVAPALVFEAMNLEDEATRRKILRLLAHPRWTRLMPEAFLEAEEIKSIIRRLRPSWLLPAPNLTEVAQLRYDWERPEGGFWSNAGEDVAPPQTDESQRSERELALARQESYEIRKRMTEQKRALPETSLGDIYHQPSDSLPGWRGQPIEYWRVPSLNVIRNELAIYTSPYREWLDSEIDVAAIESEPESLTQLWFYEISPADAPRQWTRGAFECLQAFHKVTNGTPVDSQLSSHLVDVDAVVSADRNFVQFAQKCRTDAPFELAQPRLISGGSGAVADLLAVLHDLSSKGSESA